MPQPRDLAFALGLLSRLPVPVDAAAAAARGARAAWAWPLAGAILGALQAGVAAAALALGLTPALAAGLALAAAIAMTGGLHEDGLADTADGLWGGAGRERRLEIMRDSRVGSFGVLALILSLGLRWSALAALAGSGLAPALIAAGALSRAPMVSLMARLAPARPGGLASGVGCPPRATEALAWIAALLIALALLGAAALSALTAAVAAALAVALVARAKIGGQTGDILGASQQTAEIAALASLVATL